MAKVSLRIYTREIEGLIDQNLCDEALAHCKHILKTFPKHLDTYRLLGKAYLELKRYQDAAEIFQRVLLAVPDDFVSHVGMSIIRDDEGKLDDAIWHMERAFESQPSNAAVQGELQRLYGRRDGVEPPKIRMTRGALAHMYVQGELYPQAIGEMRGVLAEDPNRMDMQALLALAYFRNGQKIEATELCSLLLKRYVYCLDANRILVEILPGTGRAENTQVYRHRVNELDPYASFVTGSVFQSSAVPDAAVNLERLNYKPGEMIDSDPAWPAALELKSGNREGHEIPDWLKAAEQQSMPSDAPEESAPKQEDSIPDFMRAVGWAAATGEAVESESAFDDSPDSEPSSGDAVRADIPDWLQAMAPADDVPGSSGMMSATDTSIPAAAGEDTEATMDWLNKLGKKADGDEPPAQEPAPKADAGIPDWLADSGESEPQPGAAPVGPIASIGDLGKTEEEQDESFLWLENLAAKQGARSDELLTTPDERLDSAPEWVQQAADVASEAPVSSQKAPAESAESDEDWLKNLQSQDQTGASLDATGAWLDGLDGLDEQEQAVSEETTAQPAEDMPGWLQDMKPSDEPPLMAEAPQEQPASSVEPAEADDGIPDWLKSMKEESSADLPPVTEIPQETPSAQATVAPADDMSDWLQSVKDETPVDEPLAAEIPPEQPPAAAVETASSTSDEVPDWLKEMESPARPDSALASAGDLPEWLRDEAVEESEAPALQPTSPAEWKPVDMSAQAEPTTQPLDAKKAVPAVPPVQLPPDAHPAPPVESLAAAVRTDPTGALAVDPTLRAAQAELSRGNVSGALQEYGKLIKKARLLDEVIFDLREALYRYPVDVLIWQALGDAYMRANRLQDALDAYTKAEELLR